MGGKEIGSEKVSLSKLYTHYIYTYVCIILTRESTYSCCSVEQNKLCWLSLIQNDQLTTIITLYIYNPACSYKSYECTKSDPLRNWKIF